MDITKDFPEECISKIISFTSPKDACRCCLVHSCFRAAADSDAVWETFLPSDYRDFISQSSSPQLNFLSKKALFFHMCDYHVLTANKNMCFALDKQSGKKCYIIGAKEFSITWGNSPQHVKWLAKPESRFPLVAELYYAWWWLEVNGRIETKILSSNTTYGVFFIFNFRSKCRFKNTRAELQVNVVGIEDESPKRVILHNSRNGPQQRIDGWMEIEMGEFFNENGCDGSVIFKIFQYDEASTKPGIIVEGVEFRPKRSE